MNTRAPFFRSLWRGVLFTATVLSVVAGIIAGTVPGTWIWMGVPMFLGVVLAAEFAASIRREVRHFKLDELAGPLPTTDEVDWDLLALHLQAWSEEN